MTTANLEPQQQSFLSHSFASTNADVIHLAGDGSSRQYFRLARPEAPSAIWGEHRSFVIMKLEGDDHEQLMKGEYPFIATHGVLQRHGFAVPAIIATAPELGLIVLEDFGDITLWEHLRSLGTAEKIAAYRRCFSPLTAFLKVQGSPADRWQQWAFDQAKLSAEFDFFLHHYVDAVHGITPAKPAALHQERDRLCAALAADSRYFCHRDFHSKNLMVQADSTKELGVIDFQDARLGPASYDAVSLFFDPYVPLSLAERHQLYGEFTALDSHEPAAVNSLKSLKVPMILQRLTKALGSFGYLTLDRKRGDYLCHQGPALAILLSLKELPSEYPEIFAILAAIEARTTDS